MEFFHQHLKELIQAGTADYIYLFNELTIKLLREGEFMKLEFIINYFEEKILSPIQRSLKIHKNSKILAQLVKDFKELTKITLKILEYNNIHNLAKRGDYDLFNTKFFGVLISLVKEGNVFAASYLLCRAYNTDPLLLKGLRKHVKVNSFLGTEKLCLSCKLGRTPFLHLPNEFSKKLYKNLITELVSKGELAVLVQHWELMNVTR